WALATGSFVSLTILFEQSKGAGLVLGLATGLGAVTLMCRSQELWSTSQCLALIAGLAWPFLVTLTYFGTEHSVSLMLADWFWPLQHYSLANHVPYGYQNWSDETRHLLFGSNSWLVLAITVVAISPCFLVPLLPLVAAGFLVYWVTCMRRRSLPESL